MEMHAELLARWGGSEGGDHRGSGYEGVEAAVNAVKNSYHEGVHELAAAYAVYIIQGHVFMDGNKRAGQAAMETFLTGNGISVDLDNEEVARLMITLQDKSESGIGTDTLISWLSDELRR